MKILVTGGTGFIGGHLTSALTKNGHQVKVIARSLERTKSLGKIGARVVIGELGDKEFLKKELAGIEAVCHLAAIPGQIWGIPWEDYKKVNVDYTQNLLEVSLINKIKRFIFCSSIQAADPSTLYGKSKLEAERAVKRSGLEYVIIRPGVVYGPGDKRMILSVCRLAKKGFLPLINGGKTKLAIIYIDDLTCLFLKCLNFGAKNKMFLGIGEEITFKNLVEIINRELRKSCWKISLPAKLVKIIAFPLETASLITGIQPLLTRQQVDFVTLDWHFDITEEERKFWQPKIKFKEGIQKTIKWYKENGYL